MSTLLFILFCVNFIDLIMSALSRIDLSINEQLKNRLKIQQSSHFFNFLTIKDDQYKKKNLQSVKYLIIKLDQIQKN